LTATARKRAGDSAEPARVPRSVVVVDHLEMFRVGVSAVLEDDGFQVVGSAMHASEGLRVAREHPAEMLIVGKQVDLKPQTALREAKRNKSSLKVMLLVERAETTDVARLVSLGVDALLLRSASGSELVDAAQRLSRGERVVAPALAAGTIGRVGPALGVDEDEAMGRSGLSRKELEVLAELATGATYKEIAESLIVTQATVKTHLVHIYSKLGVRNRQEAVARGLALGLLS
jgi:DNA-binding NarL/FixJ family response regulator